MALFAALLCVSAYISISLPIPGAPHLTLVNFMVLLISFVLPAFQPALVVAVWMLLGILVVHCHYLHRDTGFVIEINYCILHLVHIINDPCRILYLAVIRWTCIHRAAVTWQMVVLLSPPALQNAA